MQFFYILNDTSNQGLKHKKEIFLFNFFLIIIKLIQPLKVRNLKQT